MGTRIIATASDINTLWEAWLMGYEKGMFGECVLRHYGHQNVWPALAQECDPVKAYTMAWMEVVSNSREAQA